MQIIWVSGAVGHIKKINLTLTHLILGISFCALILVFIGIALQFFGFRMAIEYDPRIAARIGNLHSPVEIENLEAFYKLRLLEVNQRLEVNQQKINGLVNLNKKLVDLATPAMIQSMKPKQAAVGGKFIPLSNPDNTRPLQLSSNLLRALNSQEDYLNDVIGASQQYIQWLESKPIATPIKNTFSLSSKYGPRLDPFNLKQSFHSGLDFQSPAGTPIYATANGIVIKSTIDPSYGRLASINHGDGYISHYAHAQELYVREGDKVARGQLIGLIGTSGRSTGPHLHYEILKSGETIDPQEMIVGLRLLN
ncbi:M23 family metallopeptidase [Polynucleobacter paneuropaeus]|nr:M23 family metallopeptidase [Polynucleobacter paneuropaeus]